MQIVILEPDQIASEVLAFVAKRRGHKALMLADVEDIPRTTPFTPNVVVVALDRINDASLDRLQQVRERYPDAPVFITSERVDGQSCVRALRAGMTDVIEKPYHPHEVIMRAEMHLAASTVREEESDAATVADLSVDLARYTATKNGTELKLTKLELRLLSCLLQHHGRVSPTERLLSFGWESVEPPDGNLLKTHISHLRKKLRDAGGALFDIRSRHSLGYTLQLAGEPDEAEQVQSAS